MYFNNMNAEEGTKEKLFQDLAILAKDAEALVKATGGQLAEKSRAELVSALDRVTVSCRSLKQRSIAGAKNADHIIREYPYQSMGIAFGFGLLLGVVLNRD